MPAVSPGPLSCAPPGHPGGEHDTERECEVRAERNERSDVLREGYQRSPERFVGKPPKPPRLPEAAWNNPPAREEQEAVVGSARKGGQARSARGGETAPGAQELVPPIKRNSASEASSFSLLLRRTSRPGMFVGNRASTGPRDPVPYRVALEDPL